MAVETRVRSVESFLPSSASLVPQEYLPIDELQRKGAVPHFVHPSQITDRWLSERHYPLALMVREARRVGARLSNLKGCKVYIHMAQESTRTRVSSAFAGLDEEAEVVVTENAADSSDAKGESSISLRMMMESYRSALIIRANEPGTAERIARDSKAAIVNAGDDLHPTQTLLDTDFILERTQGRGLDGMRIGFATAPHTRVVKSNLITWASNYAIAKVYFITHPDLMPSRDITDILDERGIPYEGTQDLRKLAPELDLLYQARYWAAKDPLFRGYSTDQEKIEAARHHYDLDRYAATRETLDSLKGFCMDALPATGEVREEDADHPKLGAFRGQAGWGPIAREALLVEMLNPQAADGLLASFPKSLPQFWAKMNYQKALWEARYLYGRG
jgi:aspartate carbamoyltransferase catalytic subunit